jgi:hypothetical protein
MLELLTHPREKNEHEKLLRVARFSERFSLVLLYSEIRHWVPEAFDPAV